MLVVRQTLLSFLDDCQGRGDQVALAHRRGLRIFKWSYKKLRSTSCQIARELEARGIDKGDRVLFWAGNSAEWVAAFFGTLLRGAIAVPLDAESTVDFAERVQQQVEAKLLLKDADKPANFAPGLVAVDLLEAIAESQRRSEELYPSPDIDSKDIAEIIFTSGTTAEPKGVCITHRNLLANIEPIETEMQKYLRYERLVHPVRFLNLLPLSHVFGQFMGIFIPQLMAGEIYFLDSLNPAEIVETVKRHRISVIVTVPRILESLAGKIERDLAASSGAERFPDQLEEAENYGTLKRWWVFRKVHRRFGLKFWALISGGAALPANIEAFWRRLGFAVIQGYGMTETASLVTVNHPFRLGRGSIGKTLPGQEVKLGEKGEILVRGDNVSPGYWKRGLQPLTEGGWLKTGDVAEMDAEGNLYFKSRSKDVIVTAAGMKIFPEDLEAALKSQPEVRDCAVVSLEGAQGPEPLAVLLLADTAVDASTSVRRANKLLNQYQQIRRWILWPEADFPRTPTEKIRKPAVLARLRADGLLKLEPAGAGHKRAPSVGASSFLIEQIARITGHVPVSASASATLSSDLKLDSLGRVELLSALEDEYHLDLDEAALNEATTLGDVERLIRGSSVEAMRAPAPMSEPGLVATQIGLGGDAGAAHVRGRGSAADDLSHKAIGSGVGEDTGATTATSVAEIKTTRKVKAPPPERGHYPRWQRSWPIRAIRAAVLNALILPITRLMSRAEVVGRERLRNVRGPVLIISNHVAMVDEALILLALPGRLRRRLAIAMEGELLWSFRFPPTGTGIFKRLLGHLEYVLIVSLFNVFPLPQKSGFRRSFAYAGDCIDRGYNVLVFPEGRRTQTGVLNRFMDGIGLLATKLQVPVVPIRIDGLYELKAKRKYFGKRGQIRITVGNPVSFNLNDEASDVAEQLEVVVRSLN